MKLNKLYQLINEVLNKPKKDDCDCGCGGCNNAPILTESKAKNLLSEGLQYHINTQLPLHETIYRYGSEKHLTLIKEARKLYSRNVINLNEQDIELIKTNLGEWDLFESEVVPLDLPMVNEREDAIHIFDDGKGNTAQIDWTPDGYYATVEGEYDFQIGPEETIDDIVDKVKEEGFTNKIFEEYTVAGKKVKLNKGKKSDGTDWTVTFPNGKTTDLADVLALIKPKPELALENLTYKEPKGIDKVAGGIPYKIEGNKAIISMPLPDDVKARIIKRAKENGYSAKPNMNGGVTIFIESVNEAKKKKSTKKDPPIGKPKRGGSKAYYVYVKDPKTKKVKKVSFGSGGLRAKINNPKARKAFAARHKCSQKNDRTKPSYWSCRLPRYAKALGLGNNKNTFW